MSEEQDAPLPDLKYLRELARVVKQYNLGELEIETGEQRILLRRGSGVAPAPLPELVAAPAPVAAAAPAPAPAPAAPAEAPVEEGDFITSPFVGTFYLAPRPDAEDFCKPGDTMQAGQTVCIVEAMKLFNEIDADFNCVIEEILVENAQPVEFGAKLFRVKRL